MEKHEYLIVAILIILSIVINIFFNKSQKIYFFLDPKDKKSIELLNNILKNTNNEVILVMSPEKEDKLKDLFQNLVSIRPIKKVLNVENFSDLSEIVYETCFKNAKCIFQPHDKFYSIANKLNVQGYPFQFENNADSPSNLPADINGLASVNYGNSDKNIDLLSGNKNAGVGKLREIVQGPSGCSNTRSSRGLGE
jgi:hypothetical protein